MTYRLLSRQCSIAILALATGVLATTIAYADVLKPDFTVIRMDGPAAMTPGLSETFTIIVGNIGNKRGPVEVNVGFSGVLDQTDQIRTDNGLACDIQDGAFVNANTVLHCTGATLEPQRSLTIVVQARANTTGDGRISAQLNYSGIVNEHDIGNNYDSIAVLVK